MKITWQAMTNQGALTGYQMTAGRAVAELSWGPVYQVRQERGTGTPLHIAFQQAKAVWEAGCRMGGAEVRALKRELRYYLRLRGQQQIALHELLSDPHITDREAVALAAELDEVTAHLRNEVVMVTQRLNSLLHR